MATDPDRTAAPERAGSITRRRALALGGGLAGAYAGACATPVFGASSAHSRRLQTKHGKLPVSAIQDILQAGGSVSGGVLSIDIARSDIGPVAGPAGVTFTSAFEIDGTLTFQPLGNKRAFFNGDLPLKEGETNAVIDAIIANGLTLQAFHQHFDKMSPQVWFIHWRGIGSPRGLAHAVRAVLAATSTPLPQTMPTDPKTPLDAARLAKILHGEAEIGAEGVVTVQVARKGTIALHGVRVDPGANISTNIEIKPLNAAGSLAAIVPDFSMTSAEIQPVIRRMRKYGFEVGCLYNQETAERPQLYFSHMVKQGEPNALAAQVRHGLNLTNAD